MDFQNLIIIPSKSTKTQFVKVIQLAMGMGGEQQETKRKIKSNVRTTRKNKNSIH